MFVTATASVLSSEHAFYTENSDVRDGLAVPINLLAPELFF